MSTSSMSSAAADLTERAIIEARARLAGVVTESPLQQADRLSALTGAKVYLKREDLQVVRSYKIRGAYNLMAQLSEAEKAAGVVAASAGNHAQGVAFACRAMEVHGRIYVPTTTPKQKRDRIRAHGGRFVELIATGETYDAAAAAAQADVVETGATWVHAFDDVRTTAGQGTIGVELVEQLGGVPDVVVVPVGGGGCFAGVTRYLRSQSPEIAIVGAEPAGAASLARSLDAGEVVELATIDPFVDGAAVRRIGGIGFDVAREQGAHVWPGHDVRDVAPGAMGIVEVDEGAVCTAMLDLYQNEGVIAEPAGALSVAALAQLRFEPGATVVCLLSGGNNDVSRYNEVIERSLVHQGLKHYFLVAFPQEPGALRRFLDEVLGPDDDVTLFEYVKRNNRDTGEALVGVELGRAGDLDALLARMDRSRLHCERLEPGSPAYRYLT
ncbi:L-threonine dehydratase OS=Tsukamurella paurometabola (strain ATCC 8368 / DSM / CCUG 35730 /CIP 100753 / JCM 10117 / KCTC 9821 / NBRC 16120 / NCIMB 702349/ NCTC 13040) OX=521096 GN=ilvA PE=3 SV=1 [Tsukamurella paurometabola]|uniref:L-threonine dehydratase n=1 Tax=Tsukamurella paurometabola (strain ATCC 8368 / DSM 20162 / CCUG 35730 / CIP 100753 / JCM 10117 / KCTC 9821 / NBRC 16120 / NCIMB 702349 / NCTC 13040) TaxID=521096 RepID=D5UNN5_TSUPD|nr:threonine dehydratase [Tsukamurella paurometabola DSM 20162]SUP32379.1 L-threonine dehydratase biosynthetic IlvA [Tsukamurella paurometabola]